MFLYILRHAWAGHFGDPAWPEDALRPLTDEGRERFQRCAERLVAAGVEPGIIASSPLVRCRQTAAILAEAIPGGPKVVELPALSPGTDLERLLAWTLKHRGSGDVAWVGHAPDVGDMTGALIGDGRANIRFAKGTCVAIRFEDEPAPGRGELAWLATAKMLGC